MIFHGLCLCLYGTFTVFASRSWDSLKHVLDITNNPGNWQLSGTPDDVWSGIATSFTGQYSYATSLNSGLLKSVDYGVSWSTISNANYWSRVLCSSNGSVVTANKLNSYLQISYNYGKNFTSTSLLLANYDATGTVIAISDTGQYIFVTMYEADWVYSSRYPSYIPLFISNDFGVTFSQISSTSNVGRGGSISCSTNGQFVFAGDRTSVSISSNFGVTFANVAVNSTLTAGSATSRINFVASSGSGQHVVVILNFDSVYLSRDFGATWSLLSTPTFSDISTQFYSSSTISDDGQYLTLAIYFGHLHTSSDSGVTWMESSAFPAPWGQIRSDRTGEHAVAAMQSPGGNLFYKHSVRSGNTHVYPTTKPTSAPNTNNKIISWDYALSSQYARYTHSTSSTNGQYVVVTAGSSAVTAPQNYPSSGLYYSSDSGVTFTLSNVTSAVDDLIWTNVVCSTTCENVIALNYYYGLFSSDTFGVSFVTVAALSNVVSLYYWKNVAVSSDTQYIYTSSVRALDNEEVFWRSDDFGDTFTSLLMSPSTSSYTNSISILLSCSSSGQYVVVIRRDSEVYLSSDHGVFFVGLASNIDNTLFWSNIAISETGKYMYISGGQSLGGVAVSSNFGASFTTTNINTLSYLTAVTCSADGKTVSIASSTGRVYASMNFGAMWRQQLYLPAVKFSTLTSNDISSQIIAAGYPSFVYVFTNNTVTTTSPTFLPSVTPTRRPTMRPSAAPTPIPSFRPSLVPSEVPTLAPSYSFSPTPAPSGQPSFTPSVQPTMVPSQPSFPPSMVTPSQSPTSRTPSQTPSVRPTVSPTASLAPSVTPFTAPSHMPSDTRTPTVAPTRSRLPSTSLPTIQIPSNNTTNSDGDGSFGTQSITILIICLVVGFFLLVVAFMLVRVQAANKVYASIAVDPAPGEDIPPDTDNADTAAAAARAREEDLESGYESAHLFSEVAIPLVQVEQDGSVPIGNHTDVVTTATWVGRGAAGEGEGGTGRVVDIPSSYVVVMNNSSSMRNENIL